MISHLPLVVPVTWAVIAQSVGEAGARQECPWEACWGLHHNWPLRGFLSIHESCTQATAHGELHFTWTKCLSEGPTHHTHLNRNFSESPGPLESSPTTQRPRNTGEASHTTAGFQQGTRGSLGLGLTPLVSEPQVYEQAPVPAKGPEHPVLTSGDLNRDCQDPGREVTPHLLPSITPWWVLSDDAPPPTREGGHRPSQAGASSTARLSRDPARVQRACRWAHLLPDTWVTN